MGIFSKAARPVLPGGYFDWVAQTPQTAPPTLGAVVAIPFTSDWGPVKTPTLVGSFQEYLAMFGPTVGTPGYNAVFQAFFGEGGYEGRYGAGGVLCYRMAGSSALQAHHDFTNTTPAAALTLKGRYAGSYGNGLSVTIQDHASDSAKDELIVFLGTQQVEKYVYTDTDIAGLAAQINAHSAWIVATETVTGVKMTYVASVSLTAGNDGTTVVSGDWTDLFSAMETQSFDIFCPYGLIDGSILASLQAWAGGPSSGTSGRNANGQRFAVVYGGDTDEAAADAITDAATFNDGDVSRVGMGHVIDAILVDANGNPQVLAPSQSCARVAGILAGRGESMSLTAARLPGLTLVNGANAADKVACMNGGVMTYDQDSDPLAPVKIAAARTTFSNGAPNGPSADPAFPYLIYRNPKFMRTMQAVEKEWTQWANSKIIGRLPVNSKSRDYAISDVVARLKAREGVSIIQPGWTVAVDQNPPPSDLDEFIALVVGIKFGRSVEQFFFTVNVG